MSKKEKPFNNPFGTLSIKKVEAPKASKPPPPAQAKQQRTTSTASADEDARLFLESVGGVDRVAKRTERVGPKLPVAAADVRLRSEDSESLVRLAELVSGDGEFDFTDSDEFIEGHVVGFDANVMRKLRVGDYAPQATADLHGLTKDEAKPALERFIQNARIAGHRCVRVVTGRGLHSKDSIPVIKQSVQEWLSRGKVSKQVLAFCTATPADGGAGAVYVLLRR